MRRVSVQLSFMMFLQFFIWGGWFVTMGPYLANNLNASGAQSALAYSTQSWGAIIAPFIIGLIADRFFNAERILGILHLIGSLLMYLMYKSADFTQFYPYVLGYMILYMPTLALVNSVSFRQLSDPSKEFSKIRVWGTVGWISAGLVISYIASWDSQEAISNGLLKNTFLLAGAAALLLGIFSFTLPKTPPANKSEEVSIKSIIGLEALSLLKNRNFSIFFICSILICIPLAFYYQLTAQFLTEVKVENVAGKMTIGQISEVLFMLLLPVFLSKYGIKRTLLFGMLAWGIRYLLFAFGSDGQMGFILLIGIALHGICYDFFFVSGQIYTDYKAGPKIRSAAQGLITLATYGIGMLIGFKVAGTILDSYVTASGHNWSTIWIIPAGFAVIVLILFLLTFKNQKIKTEEING